MSVTDLTNTTWIINDNPEYVDDYNFSINFTSNNTNWTSFDMEWDMSFIIRYYNSSIGYRRVYQEETWSDISYRTINITGGSSVTNSTLISWLQNNAKQVPSDLTNTIWILNNDLSGASTIGTQGIIHLDFVSNNTTFNRIDTSEMESDGLLGYWTTNSYTTVFNSISGGWTNQAYRTINITGGTDVTNSNFILWLQENAVQQETPTPTPTPTSTGKIGDLPIIKKHFGSLEIIKEVLNGSVIYEKGTSLANFTLSNGDYLKTSNNEYFNIKE